MLPVSDVPWLVVVVSLWMWALDQFLPKAWRALMSTAFVVLFLAYQIEEWGNLAMLNRLMNHYQYCVTHQQEPSCQEGR